MYQNIFVKFNSDVENTGNCFCKNATVKETLILIITNSLSYEKKIIFSRKESY